MGIRYDYILGLDQGLKTPNTGVGTERMDRCVLILMTAIDA